MSRLKKGDEVIVMAGKDKGKRGVVLSVINNDNKVIIENINMAQRRPFWRARSAAGKLDIDGVIRI